ncbi:hypothetical protein GCM10028807_11090 [Spirosoma daeguense]
MAKNKTTETDSNVADYLQTITEHKKRNDCTEIATLMTTITGREAKMWGPSIVGFGSYHYRYDSGREGDAPLVGFSSRANAITLYLAVDFENKDELLLQLGKHKIGKGCLYIQKLEDIDIRVLEQLINHSISHLQQQYSPQNNDN